MDDKKLEELQLELEELELLLQVRDRLFKVIPGPSDFKFAVQVLALAIERLAQFHDLHLGAVRHVMNLELRRLEETGRRADFRLHMMQKVLSPDTPPEVKAVFEEGLFRRRKTKPR